ncbi:MAG: UDP-N-acetylmuramoyl-tripeptide--D-alanyl-D-alanine ligase [Clostridia bacterium]|nr:UDP-N-acetylmuramoyl-tripeptide--D-alanyl-D-alanine ligase [Clostridia bacterium]
MEPITLREIAEATNGRLLRGDPDDKVGSVCTDSRSVEPGSLFVPIIGARFDAHAFIPQALRSGAAATLSSRETGPDAETGIGSAGWIRVDDTIRALQLLSAAYRSRFDLPVVGVTGSVGKTSTKEMIADALAPGFKVLRTKGNFNNEIGLPMTLFGLERSHTAAVVEMGTSGVGEIALLTSLAAPTHAVVTNIGISHIEFFKTREAIRNEKLSITDGFPSQGGTLFLNGDDPLLAALRGKTRVPTVWFGNAPWCGYRAADVRTGEGRTSFTLIHPAGETGIVLPVTGMHHVRNALAAAAVADSLGIPPRSSAEGMKDYRGAALRQQVREGRGLKVIDDSYNASPDSVRSGLEVLAATNASGRRIAVLADMYELGDHARSAHRDAGRFAVEQGVDELVAIGTMAGWILEGAEEACRGKSDGSSRTPVQAFSTLAEAYAHLAGSIAEGDVILVKGSRGMHADRLARALVSGDEKDLEE